MKKLHIAILVCHTPTTKILKNEGDFATMIQKAFNNGATSLISSSSPLELSFDIFDVVHKREYPNDQDILAGRYNGIIISGSTDAAYENEPWILELIEFIQSIQDYSYDSSSKLMRHFKVPLIGICFGHQIIARACGGIVEQNPNGWEFGPIQIQLTDEARSFFQTDRKTMCINEFHQDHVSSLPAGFVCLASSLPHTPIQSMLSLDGKCITLQGHPELTTVVTALYLEKLASHIPESVVTKTRSQLAVPPDLDDQWLSTKLVSFFLNNLNY